MLYRRLAINSGIEAAKAGETGKGFVVVSREIQKLSSQTRKAAHDIGSQVDGIQKQINTVVAAMDEILSVMEKVGGINKTMTTSLEENKRTTSSMKEHAESTSYTVEDVANNVRKAEESVRDVANVSKNVEKELDELV